MDQLRVDSVIGLAILAFIPVFHKFSPASKSTKVWTTLYLGLAAAYVLYPVASKEALSSVRDWIVQNPYKAGLTALGVGVPLKYIQRKLRFARLNEIKWKYGITDDPKSWENMTVEQAQDIERNMAEWEFPRLWQFGWISDFFRVCNVTPACVCHVG